MLSEVLLNGNVVEATGSANATTTLTVAATPGVRCFVAGIEAEYSADITGVQQIVLTRTVAGSSVTTTFAWDFVKGPFFLPFPCLVHTDYNTAVTVTLSASGTAGVTGTIHLFHAMI